MPRRIGRPSPTPTPSPTLLLLFGALDTGTSVGVGTPVLVFESAVFVALGVALLPGGAVSPALRVVLELTGSTLAAELVAIGEETPAILGVVDEAVGVASRSCA